MRLLLLALLMVIVGCIPKNQQAMAANAIAKTANMAIPMVLAEYERQQMATVEASTTRAGALDAVAKIRKEWAPAREALAMLIVAHDAWVDAIIAGKSTDALIAEVYRAYCALRSSAKHVIILADFAGAPCYE
jgi:mannose/fructose-specific phosphotransferase system component IIA